MQLKAFVLTSVLMLAFTLTVQGEITVPEVKLTCKRTVSGKEVEVILKQRDSYVSEFILDSTIYAALNAKTGMLSLSQSDGDKGEITASGPLDDTDPLQLSVSVPRRPQEFLSCKAAEDQGLARIFSCVGTSASMEVYGNLSSGLSKGLYVLDLSGAKKNKTTESASVTLSEDKKSVVVKRKGLKPTAIPVEGGTVDFDQRLGSEAKCVADMKAQ